LKGRFGVISNLKMDSDEDQGLSGREAITSCSLVGHDVEV
jgi:hypothetical protein